ncbi:MAG: dockerin type I domain-containing protein [Planctomycetota bacterium]
MPQDNSNLTQDGENIIANLPRGICIWEYYENTETSRLYTIDFNADGIVNLIDFAIFANHWLSKFGDGNWNPNYDISLPPDNVINFLDFAVLAENLLTSTP